jgi:hypothetical protein
MDFEVFKGLLRRVAEEVEAEIRQVEGELAEAGHRGEQTGELAAVRDILYGDRWFRIATAVYAQIKKLFVEDEKAAEVIEAAERGQFGLRLEVVEAPLLKVEAAVDREGKVAAVRCRAFLDVDVETVFEGVLPGYRLEEAAGAEAGAACRGEEGGWVERALEEVKGEFSGLPVYVGAEGGYVYVKRTAPMDKRQFRRYLETCKRLGFRFDRRGERWVKSLEELQSSLEATCAVPQPGPL